MPPEQLIVTGTDDVTARIQLGVGVITLNRPESANALSKPMLDGLGSLLSAMASDDEVAAVILTGAGGRFCAGGDVRRMLAGEGIFLDAGGEAEQIAAQQRSQRETVGALVHFPKPTIAVLPGAASGAGLSLALACDVRYASTQVKIAVGFLKVGLGGDFGFGWLLPHVVGPARAREIALFSDVLDAGEALRLGVVNAVLPPEELFEFALTKAAAVKQLPRDGVTQLKRHFDLALKGGSLEECMDEEARHYVRLRQSPAHQQALERLRSR
jgi:2-(1,2-epoxy-1,2-dihydrophenyl)acetyl-CoA isomerase